MKNKMRMILYADARSLSSEPSTPILTESLHTFLKGDRSRQLADVLRDHKKTYAQYQ